MRMPHINLAPVSLIENYGFYLLVRLQAVPEVAHVLEHFLAIRAGLIEAETLYKEARQGRRAAMARRDFQNDRMDQETRVLAFTILGRVNNNRNSPLFRHYFPHGYSAVLKTPVLEQRRRSVVLLEKLEAEPDETVKTRLEPFRDQLQSLSDALDAVEEARDMEARMRGNREAAKLVWMDGYRRTYQMLQDHYAADPREAELFFREVRPRSSTPDDDELDFEADLDEANDLAVDDDDEADDQLDQEELDAELLDEAAGVRPMQVADRPRTEGTSGGGESVVTDA